MAERLKRFPLDSTQCELLLAFENAQSLNDLAQTVGRDVSVVSRQLQRVAETAPVLEKKKGRWHLTELGRQINHWSRTALNSQEKIFQQHSGFSLGHPQLPSLTEKTALVLVGVQKGFLEPAWGPRNNLNAEENVEKLLTHWRSSKRPIIHLQHLSEDSRSPLRAGSVGSEFQDFAKPRPNELVIKKNVNSGFVGTNLESELKNQKVETLILVGASGNHCVDATARHASDLGFNSYLVEDAIVTFDRIDPKGRRLAAHSIHEAMLANLHQEFCVVVETQDLLRDLPSIEG